MRIVTLEQAVGHRLACDVTEVTPAAVRSVVTKGTLIEERHLAALRDAGHVLVYIEEDGERSAATPALVEEDPACLAIARAVSGPSRAGLWPALGGAR